MRTLHGPAALLLLLLCQWAAAAGRSGGGFTHPGVLVSNADLENIRGQVAAKAGPRYVAYLKAVASPFGDPAYVPRGPPEDGKIVCGSYSHPDFGCSDESHDTSTAFVQALLWAIDGNATYARNSIAILNRYARGLKAYGLVNGTKAFNAPLQAGWSGMMYSKAAELLTHATGGGGGRPSGWGHAEQAQLAKMLTNVTVPWIYGGSGANGNWELSMLDALVGIAVFTDNATMFEHAVTFWRQRVPAYFWTLADGPYPHRVPRGRSNWNDTREGSGSWYGQKVFNASTNGVCQETCRDFGHMQMGMASAHYTAETSMIQGVDLWKEEEARLTAAMEFHSRWLLLGGARGDGDGGPRPSPAPGCEMIIWMAAVLEVCIHAGGCCAVTLGATALCVRVSVIVRCV
jgi:hypothetical protein